MGSQKLKKGTKMSKIKALAKYLECNVDDLELDHGTFKHGSKVYVVLIERLTEHKIVTKGKVGRFFWGKIKLGKTQFCIYRQD